MASRPLGPKRFVMAKEFEEIETSEIRNDEIQLEDRRLCCLRIDRWRLVDEFVKQPLHAFLQTKCQVNLIYNISFIFVLFIYLRYLFVYKLLNIYYFYYY